MNRAPIAICLLVVLTAATPTPQALAPFTAAGSLSVNAKREPDKTAAFQTAVRVLHRDTRWRIDVSNMTATASDPKTNAAAAQFLPKGTISLIIDPAKKLITTWSSMHALYFQTKMALPPAAKKKTTQATQSPLDALNSLTQYDVLSESFALIGHQPVNGRTASVYHFTAQTQKHGGKPLNVTAGLALADDLHGVPIHLDFTASDTASAQSATVQIDLTAISLTAPEDALFHPPAGYKKTAQPLAVLH